MESYLRVNLFGIESSTYEKKNLPGRCLTKFEKYRYTKSLNRQTNACSLLIFYLLKFT